jgi:hypothetical protein
LLLFYNVYLILTKSYKLKYKIGDYSENEKAFKKQSFIFKIKFILYIFLGVINIFMLLVYLMILIFKTIFNEPKKIKDFLKFIDNKVLSLI